MADNTSLLSDQFHQSVAITEEGPWNRFQKVLSQFRLTPTWTEKHLNELGNYNKIIQYSVIIQNLDGGTIQNLVGPYYSNSKGKKHDIADALLKSCFLLDRFPHLKRPDETNYIFSSLNFHLLSLVKLFIPNKSENSSHKILGHISKCLREHGKGRVSIDRLILSGSSGKNTSLGSSFDVDIIAFLNDRRPPFQHDIYESVADILKTGLQKDLECKDLVIGKRSLQFTLMGVEVDLLFAHSFDQKRQLELAIEYLAKIPEDCRSDDIVSYYSTCFSETSVAFIEQQHGNTNIFVRMAKLWASMIMVISKFDSKSYLFELLAVKASEMERAVHGQNDKDFSFLAAFYHFLTLISDYPNINIVWTKFYAETAVPSSIRCQRPLVLDPANPLNNVGRQDRVPWVELQKAAKQTLVVVNDYLDRMRWSTNQEGLEKLSSKLVSAQVLLDIFQPHIFRPTICVSSFRIDHNDPRMPGSKLSKVVYKGSTYAIHQMIKYRIGNLLLNRLSILAHVESLRTHNPNPTTGKVEEQLVLGNIVGKLNSELAVRLNEIFEAPKENGRTQHTEVGECTLIIPLKSVHQFSGEYNVTITVHEY